ncbi:Flr1 protein [Starmerella bacillaris]|uniref:Flr1 protein n=1 Tax=Starmerella bacillaris TaxID=1247836 RepID=A0AAV5RKJ3_STABA|nr:Flr1 protein [Starmerella bacillaris]
MTSDSNSSCDSSDERKLEFTTTQNEPHSDLESFNSGKEHEDEEKPNPFADVEFAQGKTIVDWDGPDDPENPQNWKLWRKLVVTILISLTTTSLYMGAAIYSPAIPEVMRDMDVPEVKAALGLTLFVWGYGIGSLWFSPMSEIPFFRGRNPTYFACQFIFAILQIPTALSNHIGGFAVLRFLGGIFASPPLSTAGATLGDIWVLPAYAVALIIWAFGAIAGPFLGPLIGGALVQGHNRHYIFWFMLAVSGGMFVLMIIFLPETSAQELLTRKARRLRKETGDPNIVSPGEIINHTQTVKEILKLMFFKPIEMTIMEPVLLLIDLHLGLVYSLMYLYFEAFPLVYQGLYGFNLVELGCAYLSLLIGAVIGCIVYLGYMGYAGPRITELEKLFSLSASFGACLLPVGIMIFGWCGREGFNWSVSMVGNIFFAWAAFILFQSYFGFIGIMYPPSAVGSAFASNNIVRSLMGGAFPLFGTVMYNHTAIDKYPVGWGCTILGIVALMLIPLPIYLYFRGKSLREYAQKKYGGKLHR